METELSIVIPTYKPRILDSTLKALSRQKYKGFETVIVENGSKSDFTIDLVSRYEGDINGRYTFIAELGLNNARNIGTRLSQGRLIALTDDDCMPDEYWTKNIVQSYYDNPSAGIIGGRVDLKFGTPPPKWFLSPFRELVGELNIGNERKELSGMDYLVGANFSFTRDVFEEVGGFDINIGQRGRNFQANDEVLFLELIRSKGFQVLYDPHMAVFHNVSPERQTIEYIEKRFYGQGVSDVKKEWLLGKNSGEILEFLEIRLLNAPWSLETLTKMKGTLDDSSKEKYWENFMRARIAYLNGLRDELVSGGTENENMS